MQLAAGSWLLMLAQLDELLLLPCTTHLHSRSGTALAAAQVSGCHAGALYAALDIADMSQSSFLTCIPIARVWSSHCAPLAHQRQIGPLLHYHRSTADTLPQRRRRHMQHLFVCAIRTSAHVVPDSHALELTQTPESSERHSK